MTAEHQPLAIELDEELEANPPPANRLTDLEIEQLLPSIPDSGAVTEWRRTCETLFARGMSVFESPRAYYNSVIKLLNFFGHSSMDEVTIGEQEEVRNCIKGNIVDARNAVAIARARQ